MAETEGVIKYRLDFHPDSPAPVDFRELNIWRNILFGLQLIGQDVNRYLGYAYGNLSMRDPHAPGHFLISGSQTGILTELGPQHYARIERCDIDHNRVIASGPIRPSSEALTHAMIYQADAQVRCVLHIHDPTLWQYGLAQDLPTSSAQVEYGTPAMAHEVARLFASAQLARVGTLIMAGHEDGVICFGDSIAEAGARLLRLYVDAAA